MTAAPVTIAVMVPMTQPKQWNRGTGMQMRSRSESCMYWPIKRALFTRLK